MDKRRLLYGLVVCGGNSKRMGIDKCMLDYHGLPQWQYIFNNVKDLCDAILISCNLQQLNLLPSSLAVITDDERYSGKGPMAALLSAAAKYPDVDFLLIGCDYPLLTPIDIKQLVVSYYNKEQTTAGWNKVEEVYDPLIAIYTAESIVAAQELFAEGNHSLQFVLREVNAFKVELSSVNMKSVDTPQQYLAVKQLLRDAALKNDQISEGTVF